MRRTPVFILIAILAIVVTGVGLATIIVVQSHGYLLDPDGRAHVQALTGLDYGVPSRVATPVPKPPVTVIPTVQPKPMTVSQILISVFGKNAVQAEHVAMCMSGEKATLTNAAGGMGIFGIRAPTWAMSPYAKQSPFDAVANIKAAYWLFQKSGMSWYRWGICAP